MRPLFKTGILCLGVGLMGCALKIDPPDVPSSAPEAAWARVLESSVDERGRIDFAGIRAAPADLDAMVAYVARMSPETDPESFPTIEARLAYYLNAYNALAMRHAAYSGVRPRSRIRFFYLSSLRVGGRWMSLRDLEKDIIRPAGDPRVHFALCRMTRASPRLAREPFAAETLDGQLESAAREFLSDDRNVLVDTGKGVVRFSRVLKWYRKDFLAQSRSLRDYVNRYRDRKIPAGVKVKFLPYDWTLNNFRREGR